MPPGSRARSCAAWSRTVLTALGSTVRLEEYGEAALRANLEDLAWLEATTRALMDRAASDTFTGDIPARPTRGPEHRAPPRRRRGHGNTHTGRCSGCGPTPKRSSGTWSNWC